MNTTIAHRLPLTVVLSLAVAGTGCLSATHVIPRGELQTLAQQPPEQRAERVRVVQGFAGTAEDPPPAPVVHSHTVVVVDGPVRVGPRVSRRPRYDHGGPGHIGSSGSKAAKAAADDSKAWLIVAAALGVGLAVTEGARFDGWVKLHPMHPVHLYGPNGEYTWVPLAQLDPGTAAWASKAFVRETEGPWDRLERAPLDRRGWTYAVLLGSGEITAADGTKSGFMGHVQFGYFPVQTVGILVDIGVGWRNDDRAETIYDSRWALELQALPLAAGPIHGGLFGQFGAATRLDDGPGPDRSGNLLGGGALVQLDLTTYLALTARAGVTYLYGEPVSDLTLGLSIY
ncbi:hypothetical protein [Haliangium sp.]|uniref:hypothetical protein n=1 Tax=Haliangium sp. TaxID=2663208 RepID=UPI003D142E4E